MVMKRISLAVCLFVAACDGGEDGASATSQETAAFKDMSFEERSAFMADVVLPDMKETFVAFDPKFESMTCQTCHGDGAIDGSFAMPSPKLPVLPGTEEAFMEYAKDPEHGRWAQFMYEKVTPQLADLLEVTRFDPTTGTGEFSCNNCHTLEGVEN
jgi:hypothetical protein